MREMKDSGFEWIGKIPANWEVDKLKFHLKRNEPRNPGDTVVLSLYRELGVIPKDSRDDNHNATSEDTSKYKYVQPGNFVINKMKAWQGSVAVSEYEGIVSPAYFVYKFTDDAYYRRYFHYLLRSCYKDEFMRLSGGIRVGQWDLPSVALDNTAVIIPPIFEQKRIADFLDTKCAEIDALTADIQTQIDTLEQYKRSVINEAVTKGLNPNAEMKDSGIEWVGEIPKKWSFPKITHILDYTHPYPIGDGDHGSIKSTEYKDEGIPFIRVQNLGFATELNLEDVVYISESQNDTIKNSSLHPGDVLFAKTGATIGKVGIVPEEIRLANTTSHVGKITVSKDIIPKFVFYILASHIGYKQFWDIAAQKSTRPELSIDEIKTIHVLLPDTIEEQTAIVNYLDEKCIQIDGAVQNKKEQLETLAEYKKSVIYEYVTGKKEVPADGVQ